MESGDTDTPAPDATPPSDDLDGTVTTVDELNNDIASVIKRARHTDLDFDFVIGDVSNDSIADGTRYFELVNDDAGMQCLVFERTRSTLPDFDEGDRVAVKGRLNYYEERGNCSLYVDEVTLLGDSHYHKEIEETRETLADEGYFEDDAKQELPPYPAGIGIVTATGSDAEQDAIKGIHDRHPDVNIYVCDSRVQGISALDDLCTGVTFLDAHPDVDVIVVTRGGGSEQALYPFNTEGISRVIYDTNTPVVTAIGHEDDRPIVDDVADTRAMTPTEIGSVVAPSKQDFDEQQSRLQTGLTTAYGRFATTRIDEFITTVTTVYTDFTQTRLSGLQSELTDAYTLHVDRTTTQLQQDVTGSYEQFANQETTVLRNRLDAAFRSFEQQKQHDAEAEALEQQQRRYKLAAAALLVLVLLLVTLFFLGVL